MMPLTRWGGPGPALSRPDSRMVFRPMNPFLRIEMLGRFAVQQDHREITRFRTRKTAALLAYMALNRERGHPRETLIELFWPDSPLEAARTNLSVALNALRRQVEPPGVPHGAVLSADHSQVRLLPSAFETDVEAFERTCADAESRTGVEKRLEGWKAAVRLYRGDLLPGFYEDWVLSERDRLRASYLGALRQVVAGYAETRRYEPALEYAHRMVQADPHREASYRNLIRLYLALGRPAEAVQQYRALERILRDELQTTPSPSTREMVDSLPESATARRPHMEGTASGPGLTAPLSHPASLSTLSEPDAPRPVFRVPRPFTRFFGQEETLTRLCDALGHDSGFRLVTLTGIGGAGKTRLSLEAAARVREVFPGGIWFVPLAAMTDPLLLGEALRDTLELSRKAGPSALDAVAAFLMEQARPCLLILDNFEQVAAGGAPMIWSLLGRVPALKCLVTSRHALALPGERDIPVLPLPAPLAARDPSPTPLAPDDLLAYPSVGLFVDRALSARPEFQITPRNAGPIAAICEKLEGIPLALELAAARASVLAPAQILERLSERFALLASRHADREERHRSLWAAIDWSYRLLPPALQRFFERLSVFRGGWSLEAAADVCDTPAALEYLSQLRLHSLVQAAESFTAIRFRMLETIREFAAEQIALEERRETERRHTAYFGKWVQDGSEGVAGRQEWHDRLEEDLDNLRAALAWSLREEGDIALGLQTASQLDVFWRSRGYHSEGRRWYAQLLERVGDTPTEAWCRPLYGASTLAYLQGDFTAARALLERCIEVSRSFDSKSVLASAYDMAGSVAYREGDYAQARGHYEESLALARGLGLRLSVAGALGNLANVAQSAGDFDACRALNEESLAIRREEQDRPGEARTLHNLANLAYSQGRLEEARMLFTQSLQMKREMADRYGQSYSLTGLAGVAVDQGDLATAAACTRESLALARALDARMNLVDLLDLSTKLAQALEEVVSAARLCGALQQVKEEMRYSDAPVEQEARKRLHADLRQSLGSEAYLSSVMEGRQLSLEQALIEMEEMLTHRSL